MSIGLPLLEVPLYMHWCVIFSLFPSIPQDLSRLGRDIRKVVIIDNSPQSYIFHPDNAVSDKHTGTMHKQSMYSGTSE